MRPRRALRMLLLLAALAPGSAAAQVRTVPGERLVTLRAAPDAAALRRLEVETGGRVLATIPQLRLVRLALPPGGGEAVALRAVDRLAEVEASQPIGIGQGGFVPADPLFAAQWHLEHTGQVEGTPGADIDAPRGWASTRGDADVVVAVLDSGIDFAHPEFQGRLLPGWDFVDDDGDPSADHPHGIHVTGLLAANADGVGVVGVDHAATLLPVKVLDWKNEGREDDLIEAIVWATDQGADVIAMSLVRYPRSRALGAALEYAHERGVVLVACAGNDGLGDADVSAPGAFPQTISVGWTDAFDLRGFVPSTSSSATGRALDLVAPGAGLVTVSGDGRPGEADLFTGCSAATPLVAGIASLLLAVDPTLTPDDVRDVLVASAVDQIGPPGEDTPGRDDFYGWGRANLAGALALVPEPGAPAAGAAALLALAALGRAAARARRLPSAEPTR